MSAVQHYYSQIQIGMRAQLEKTVTDADVRGFSQLSGDTNPLHMDEEYARTTFFGQRVVHGMLSASLISAVLGSKLPGPGCVYVSQSLKFKRPVHIGDSVVATSECVGKRDDKKSCVFKTQCLVGSKVVIDGEAVILVPEKVS